MEYRLINEKEKFNNDLINKEDIDSSLFTYVCCNEIGRASCRERVSSPV